MTENTDENVITLYRGVSGVTAGSYVVGVSDKFSKASAMIFAARFGAIAEKKNVDFSDWFFSRVVTPSPGDILLYKGEKTDTNSFHYIADEIVDAILKDKKQLNATVLVTVKGVPLQVVS